MQQARRSRRVYGGGVPVREYGSELCHHVHAAAARGEQLWRDLVEPRACRSVLRVRRVAEEVAGRDEPLVVPKLTDGGREGRHGFPTVVTTVTTVVTTVTTVG